MKCPPDVDREHFEAMLETVPDGFTFKRSYVYVPKDCDSPLWRNFVFVATRRVREFKKGNELELSCVRNIGTAL